LRHARPRLLATSASEVVEALLEFRDVRRKVQNGRTHLAGPDRPPPVQGPRNLVQVDANRMQLRPQAPEGRALFGRKHRPVSGEFMKRAADQIRARQPQFRLKNCENGQVLIGRK